jgi:hypothetical protein
MAVSEYKSYAVHVAATPNDFARLTFRVSRHKRQFELVPYTHRRVRHDFRPPGETSSTRHSRLVIPSSIVNHAGRLRSCRRGSRCIFVLGLSIVMMTIRRWT